MTSSEAEHHERCGAAAATTRRLLSTWSNSSSTSTDRDAQRSASECSPNASKLSSAGSLGRRRQLLLPSQRSAPPNPLHVFAFHELRSAARGFSRAPMLGEGGFGCVYQGTVRSTPEPRRGLDVAIKQLSHKGLQRHKEWMTEMNVLELLDHANLVKLVGYCDEDDERGMQLLQIEPLGYVIVVAVHPKHEELKKEKERTRKRKLERVTSDVRMKGWCCHWL